MDNKTDYFAVINDIVNGNSNDATQKLTDIVDNKINNLATDYISEKMSKGQYDLFLDNSPK